MGPKTAHAFLLKHGWTQIGKPAENQPHWKGIGPAIHNVRTYARPGWDFAGHVIRVNSGGGFEHVVHGVRQHNGPSGKFGINVSNYLDKLHNKDQAAPVQSPVGVRPVADHTSLEEKLKTSNVSGVKGLGGGVNITKVLTLGDGSKAVFKIDSMSPMGRPVTPGKDNEREAAAWQIAKHAGLADLGSPCIVRTVALNGVPTKGAMMVFHGDATVAQEVRDFTPGKPIEPDARFDGQKDMLRAAAFDWVIGNSDRHAGNWMVQKPNTPEAKLKLIDHGLAFPESPRSAYSKFIDKAVEREQDGKIGERGTRPKDFAEGYVANKNAILDSMTKLGIAQSAVRLVSDRIDKLSTARQWSDLKR